MKLIVSLSPRDVKTHDVIVAVDHWSIRGARVSSVPYDYEDEPEEDEEPQDGSGADDSEWYAGQWR
jgi:hypothetical protein